MATCPRCDEEVAPGAGSCGACGASLRLGKQIRWYVVSTATLAAVIVGAALLHSYLETRVVRSPLEFVPASARAVVALDLRPGSAAGRRVTRTWSEGDRRALGARACELAQRAVDWSGLRLDVRKSAGQWFGGELLIASIGGPEARSFTPRSFVLVVRVTSLRRARGDLHRAVEDIAREGGWERRTLRSSGRMVTVWGPAGGDSEIAYATADGCLVVSASHELVELCLRTAGDPAARLMRSARFHAVRTRLPADALIWGYLGAGDLIQAVRETLPSLRQGWVGLVRHYLTLRAGPGIPREGAAEGDSIAVAIAPEPEGMRLHASYLPASGKPALAPPGAGDRLLELLPQEALAFAFFRDAPGVVKVLTGREQQGRRAPVAGRWGVSGLLLRPELVPESLLVTVLPREGTARPAVAAAFAGEKSEQTTESLLRVAPTIKAVEVSGAQVVASDDQAIGRMQAAAKAPAERLKIEAGGEVEMQLWARPAALSPRLARVEEVGLALRRGESGAEVEVSVKAEPRHLLGGG